MKPWNIRGGYIGTTNRSSKISLLDVTTSGNSEISYLNRDPLIIMEREQNVPAADHYKLKQTRDWSHRKSIKGLGAVFTRSKRKCIFTDQNLSITNNQNESFKTKNAITSNDSVDIQDANSNSNIVTMKTTHFISYLLFNLCICIGIVLLFPHKNNN